ncbi:MAG: trypsin-like peptidase domain-containing protein [Chloroflexi bacterium]|nr:trypsin-like peptidase domain-containing protein [Chloroflexota bacterium]
MPLQGLGPHDPVQVGPYALRGRLGSGGMGVVYLAFAGDGTPIALKTLPSGVDAEVRRRLRREAELLRGVRHARIAGFVAADLDDDPPWLAMDYVAGPSLADAATPLAQAPLRQLTDGLAEALGAMHEVGLTHRDVKPANIILTFDGPVLVDLGIAVGADVTSMTATGAIIGTPAWMAPEQLLGGVVGPATDVWGWASVAYYAASGRPAFGDGELAALAFRILHADVPLESLPSWLRGKVGAGLAKDPARRPPVASLVAGPTREIETEEPAPASTAMVSAFQTAQPTPTVRHVVPATKRRPTRWWLLVLVAALVSASAVVAALLVRHGHGAPDAKAAASNSSHVTTPPESSSTFLNLYARRQSGVVRIETTSCDASGVGTGFLLSPTLIATVDHVVDQSAVITLIHGVQRATGTVIGSDLSQDLALIRSDTPLTGYHFTLANSDPAVGARVASIGFPIGDPITLTQGAISGLHRDIKIERTPHSDFIATDTSLDPGNSGGPLLTIDGVVAGLVDAGSTQANGTAYAVPARLAAPKFTRWTATPSPEPHATCKNPLGPSQEANPNIPPPTTGTISAADAAGIAAAFNTYFGGINSGNYAAAWAVLSPRLRAGSNEQSFAEGDSTSYDFGVTVLDAQGHSPGTAVVAVGFTSLQDAAHGPDGDTCDNWTIAYSLIKSGDGRWLLDSTQPYLGKRHTTC